MSNHIYPDLPGVMKDGKASPPVFPSFCPCCGTRLERFGTGEYAQAVYGCDGRWRRALEREGAWWVGQCPKARRAAEVGLPADVPDNVLHDARVEAGLRG